MYIKGKEVIFRQNGRTYTVAEHTDWENVLSKDNLITISIDGEPAVFGYTIALTGGSIRLADDALQQEATNEIAAAECERAAAEREELAQTEARLAAERAAREAALANGNRARSPRAIVQCIAETDALIAGEYYGTDTREIYKECSEKFHFAPELVRKFGWGRKLYAQNATPEGYSVWMLWQSNLTRPDADPAENNWTNNVSHDYNTIVEQWEKTNGHEFKGDKTTRLVFAKHNNTYMFLGIYECCNVDADRREKTYRRIAERYPLQK